MHAVGQARHAVGQARHAVRQARHAVRQARHAVRQARHAVRQVRHPAARGRGVKGTPRQGTVMAVGQGNQGRCPAACQQHRTKGPTSEVGRVQLHSGEPADLEIEAPVGVGRAQAELVLYAGILPARMPRPRKRRRLPNRCRQLLDQRRQHVIHLVDHLLVATPSRARRSASHSPRQRLNLSASASTLPSASASTLASLVHAAHGACRPPPPATCSARNLHICDGRHA